MVCPLFFYCMNRRLIIGVVSEVVAQTHVWYHPPCQCMHVFSCTDQLGTQSLGLVRMRLRGVLEPTNLTME